jgi:hypothetical protein
MWHVGTHRQIHTEKGKTTLFIVYATFFGPALLKLYFFISSWGKYWRCIPANAIEPSIIATFPDQNQTLSIPVLRLDDFQTDDPSWENSPG